MMSEELLPAVCLLFASQCFSFGEIKPARRWWWVTGEVCYLGSLTEVEWLVGGVKNEVSFKAKVITALFEVGEVV